MKNNDAQKEDSSNAIFWVIGAVATIIIILMLASEITSDDSNENDSSNGTNAVPTIQDDNGATDNQDGGVRSNENDDIIETND